MSKSAKTIVTIVVVIVFLYIFSIVGNSGMESAGVIAIALVAALIGALRAIWKKNRSDKKNDDNGNDSILQK